MRKEFKMSKNVYVVMEFGEGKWDGMIESAWSSQQKAIDYVHYMVKESPDQFYCKFGDFDLPDQKGKTQLVIFEQEVNPFEHIASSKKKK
jgi:hypothetical protein